MWRAGPLKAQKGRREETAPYYAARTQKTEELYPV
ncbi:hypothetical protein UFOVP351_34 [uncultured Caudovirales phage]|uniref:Uncharacterized protein n=1 Tax=uncultured Caudovirales phage TaxID=2100421 RepID=A0A6J5LZG4_9CAUD|nr:hypothetical protein UFOVP351_34 [uncultured Caudovirales phage]